MKAFGCYGNIAAIFLHIAIRKYGYLYRQGIRVPVNLSSRFVDLRPISFNVVYCLLFCACRVFFNTLHSFG